MAANYYGLLNNSRWLTHVATITWPGELNIRFLRDPSLFLQKSGAIRPAMRRTCLALFVIAGLRQPAVAEPDAPAAPAAKPPDPSVTVTASPWIDLAPATVLEKHAAAEVPEDHKVAAAVTLSGM